MPRPAGCLMLNTECRPGIPGPSGGLIPEGIALRGMPLTVGAWPAAPGWLLDAEPEMQAGHARPLRWIDTGGDCAAGYAVNRRGVACRARLIIWRRIRNAGRAYPATPVG
ncbi:hypothetical protein ACQKFN_14010 [Serratia sp. NPDC071084]|uniref:hypothetical protein n=1 Tax=Serratia sp. NPDC071084 TaxID=3390676 RepID=UPI003D08176A